MRPSLGWVPFYEASYFIGSDLQTPGDSVFQVVAALSQAS